MGARRRGPARPRCVRQDVTAGLALLLAAPGGRARWFDLYPDQKIAPSDPLHWTGPNQTWNYMCADCHSTNLHKNYDLAKDSYATTWSEIDVSCEVSWTWLESRGLGAIASKVLIERAAAMACP